MRITHFESIERANIVLSSEHDSCNAGCVSITTVAGRFYCFCRWYSEARVPADSNALADSWFVVPASCFYLKGYQVEFQKEIHICDYLSDDVSLI